MKNAPQAARRYWKFMLFAIAAMFINLLTTNVAGYADAFSNTAFGTGIALLFGFIALYRAGYRIAALVLTGLFFNIFFSLFSYLYGLKSLITIYYLPFLISCIYLFKDECNRTHALVFFLTCTAFITGLMLFCPMDPASLLVREEHISIMHRKNFVIAFILSSYYFFSIFNYMVGKNQDLEAQKELAEEGSRSKARFLSVMSHELRTPLNGIVGMINLMSSPISESEQKRYLDILKTTSLHLLHLVNNVLDYSKASAGKMELNPVPCSLDEIVRNLHSVFLPRFAEKKLDFLLSVDILLKTTVLADDVRMVQVLTNLLSNALKFTAAGRVTLEAHCLQKSSDRMVVECSVSDTGPGIAREEQVHLFDSFNNIQNKPRHAESTGLGLAISRMIVSEMGGMLQLESVKGKGSRFSIRITLPLVVEAPRPEVLLNSIPDAVSLTGIRVLIAEDNPVNMMIARTILKKWQIQTVEAVNGRIALDLLQEGAAPDLILLDLHMPEMNGYEAMERIREVHPDLPVIAFTASMLAAEERAELARLGFLDVVPKPFAPEELEAKMKAALARGTLVQA